MMLTRNFWFSLIKFTYTYIDRVMSISIFILLFLQLFMWFGIFSKFQLKKLFAADKLLDHSFRGFPGSSVGKESTCSAGDPGSIPGLGKCSREGKGHPLQYSDLENYVDSPWGCRVGHNWVTFTSSFQLILYNSFWCWYSHKILGDNLF